GDPHRGHGVLRADLPPLLPDIRPARRRPDRSARHPQHARDVPVRGAQRADRPRARRSPAHMSDVVRYEVADRIAWLTIDRPEARNALSKAVRDGLWDGFRRFESDEEAAVLVLTATGEKAFCAG